MRTLLLILFALVSFPAFSSSYTKIANNGTDLPDSAVLGSGATDWACTRDDTSGLIWEVKTGDGGLRDANKTYTNYDDLTQAQKFTGSAWINPTQVEIDAASNSIGFTKAVNSQALCGHVDWKIPNKDELLSLMDPVYNPRINPSYFQLMPVTNYWSGTPYSSATFGATYMIFPIFMSATATVPKPIRYASFPPFSLGAPFHLRSELSVPVQVASPKFMVGSLAKAWPVLCRGLA